MIFFEALFSPLLTSESLGAKNLTFLGLSLIFGIGAAISDLRTRTVPNWYNLLFFISAVFLQIIFAFFSGDWFYALDSLIGFLVGLAVLFPFFLIRMAGGGDVKMLAVLGALLGWKQFIWVFVFTTLWDGLILLPFYFIKRLATFFLIPLPLEDKLKNIKAHLADGERSRKKPYALPVCLGCLSYAALLFYAIKFITTTNFSFAP
jgi:Flp pilus assembly protein protease CpaA